MLVEKASGGQDAVQPLPSKLPDPAHAASSVELAEPCAPYGRVEY